MDSPCRKFSTEKNEELPRFSTAQPIVKSRRSSEIHLDEN